LNRIASKCTKAKQVIALGGGGVAANEAEAGFADGVKWTVYALSRGKKEEYPALCDFAHKNKSNKMMTFVTGKDTAESDAFHEFPAQEAAEAKKKKATPPSPSARIEPKPDVTSQDLGLRRSLAPAMAEKVRVPKPPPRPIGGVAVPSKYDPPAKGRKRPMPPSAAAPDLLWECMKNSSSFMRRPVTGDRRKSFSADPTNLRGLHTPKYCGLAASEPLGICAVKDGDKESIRIVQSHPNPDKASSPSSALVSSGLSKCPKKGLPQLDRELDGKFYRRGLHLVARERYDKVQKSFRKKKRIVKSRRSSK